MARYTGAVCRLCRREDMKLFLKGERCYTDKCGYERRSYPPGQHGQNRRKKRSDYGEQLREKQKVKRIYGIAERQFRGYYHKATRMKGVAGHNLIQLLERRLDNVVYRMGFASDHAEARQLVRHGHFLINGKKVNIPSYLVRSRDVIVVREGSQKMTRINEALAAVDRRGVPQWIGLDKGAFTGTIQQLPAREDVNLPIREQLIIELYSK
ncbi:MAG: 30S ribosomal protein S4 [Kofleriaceae bacterium]|jgi:small subunit ribosomal protein S4|nr:30S ribosomal protein S4 [Kofleriaceae bacterium]MBP6836719.1 30S ribosomal protein S4 [Kofleriaceae bacterium]